MTTSLTQPAIGSTNWGAVVNTNWQTIQDMLNGCLVNPIINGGFDFYQRQTPGTYTTISDNKYGPDRWRITRQTADVQASRLDGTGVSGLNSKNYGGFKQITAAGKFHVSQWIENVDSVPRLSRTVTFQLKLKATSAKTIRIAVLELQSAGTADSIPATLVTTWNANGTDPTLATNVAIVGSVVSCSVTTSFTLFACSVSVPSNSKNIAVAIWTDSQFSANDELHVAEVGLYNGNTGETPNWYPRQSQQEIALCQRYFEKSYDVDTIPGTATEIGSIRGMAYNANYLTYTSLRFLVKKRAGPTIAFYSVGSGASGKIRDISTAGDLNISSANVGEHGCLVYEPGATWTASHIMEYQFTAEADL